MKLCLRCNENKPENEFGKRQGRVYCDECKGNLEHEMGLIKYYLEQIKQKWQKIK